MAAETPRVLVVGAGPGGLTAAIGLQRVGIRAEVYEEAREVRPIGAGLGVQSNALKALMRIGVGRRLIDRGTEVRFVDVYSGDDRPLADFPQGEVSDEFGLPTLNVLRADLQFELMDALEDGTLHLGAKALSVEQDEAGVTVRFEDGREERGALLVGADGIRSTIKPYVVDDTALHYTGFCGWRSWVQLEKELLPADRSHLILGRGCAFVMFPTGEGLYWGCMRKTEPGGTNPPSGIRDELIEFVTPRFPERARRAVEAATDDKILRTDIYDRNPISTWFNGRIVLVGDAIHPCAPFVGQGAGISIEDGVVLAKELSLTHGLRDQAMIDAALVSYQARREPRATWMVQQGRNRGRLASLESPVLCAARHAAIRAVPSRLWRKQLEDLVKYDV